MNIQVLTDAPGGYVEIDPSEVVKADRQYRSDSVRMRFRNGDFVIVSDAVGRNLGRLGIIPPR